MGDLLLGWLLLALGAVAQVGRLELERVRRKIELARQAWRRGGRLETCR